MEVFVRGSAFFFFFSFSLTVFKIRTGENKKKKHPDTTHYGCVLITVLYLRKETNLIRFLEGLSPQVQTHLLGKLQKPLRAAIRDLKSAKSEP